MLFKKKNKKNNKIKVLLICGISGSGKTWIENDLIKHSTDKLEFHKLKQYTTRKPRSDEEINMNIYEFIDDEKYDKIKDTLIAKTEVNGCKYGTLQDFRKSTNKTTIINTIIVNRRGHDDIISFLKNFEYINNYDIITLEVKVQNEIKNRSDRNIEKEKKELENIANISIDNSFGNRVNYKDVIKLLKSVEFI